MIDLNIERDHAIMRILKVDSVIHKICTSSKGELSYILRKGEDKYTLLLDSVPYENKELAAVLK